MLVKEEWHNIRVILKDEMNVIRIILSLLLGYLQVRVWSLY